MTTDVRPSGGGGGAGAGTLERSGGSGLADVLDTILDKGIVIDAYVQANVVGIDILTINARVVVASIDTYLRFAEAVNRLDLSQDKGEGVPELLDDAKQAVGGQGGGVSHAVQAAADTLRDIVPDRKD